MEEIEKAGNSQLARELEVALPIELSREEQLRLVREYCSSQFVSKGMCADFNIHDTGSGNPHAHILLTMRPMDEQGKWLPKSKKEYLLAEKGIFTLEELDAALSSVSDKASEIRGAMKPREARIKQLQKLIEQAQNFQKTKPVHDEYKQIRWKGKQEKFAETHRADLTIWEAANRYLRANLPDMKLAPKAWQTELAKLTAENEAEYAKLKAQREVVSDLQKIHRYVDIALKEDAPQQSKTRNHNIDR